MAFEVLLDQVGSLGRFQILQLAFFFISIVLLYPRILLENFTAAIPDHRCWVHILDNDTVSNNDTGTLGQDALLRVSIPLDSNLRPEKCRRFVHPQWQLLYPNESFSNMSELDTEPCVDGWVYDRSFFFSTIVTEWDLVCESQLQKSVAQFLLMAGSLLGGLVYGYLADRFGRKIICRCCLLQLAISDTCAAFAPNFFIYCSLCFLAGFCIMSLLGNLYVLAVEWTNPQSRSMTLILLSSAYSVGQMVLGGLAFAIRDWRTLKLTLSIPVFVFFLSSRWMVESARWLIINHQLDEGLKELRRVAHINGKMVSGEILTTEFLSSTMQEELDRAQIKASVSFLFHAPKLRMRVLYLSFVSLMTIVPYYGLILNVEHLGRNVYLFQVLFGAVTLIGRFFALWTLNHMGRRLSQMLLMFLVGLSILVNTFLSQEMQMLRVALGTLGAGTLSAALTSFGVHSCELIPTIVRSTVGGISIVFSRIGAALSPLLMILMRYSPHLPWITYGVFPIVAGLIVLLLPETRNLPLPNTIEDVENDRKETRNVEQEDTYMKITQF
ncbi:LOW QUALITY PROTEIN: steroid transmembrane transporter SLC22A24-like [Nycticebus coucang]|uniref:LOW QUALITY PROTEIN: steroid transmembrane transporter SLC22A24-like n=1 Tax=Nycticebus coucang TaxID=9470 RepID=UPI00234C27AF|nr:LOW QUALITY PROTEIN: steroid transmembrane transporter SLC22A24-like [Nycticebus coucang]